ncbi:MAG: hypothetical protein K2L83_02160 [Muribaculaceae bacterium]|nr:hypothetical protein [Muribaculaceae bacterium]
MAGVGILLFSLSRAVGRIRRVASSARLARGGDMAESSAWRLARLLSNNK